MHRIYHGTAVSSLPAPDAPGAPGFYTKGSPGGQPATVVTADWANALQEEIAYVITQAGIALSKANNTQLRQAILSMVSGAANSIRIDNATFAVGVVAGEAVRWDGGAGNFAKAIADGTANNRAVGFADVANALVYAYGETPALFAGLAPGSRYYLSGSVAGAITDIVSSDSIVVGVAKSATTLFVDIDVGVVALLGTRNIWNKAQDVAQVALVDAASIATDTSLSNVFVITLGGNRTLANPTNGVAGQTLIWNIRQDATGGRTLAFDTLFKFPVGTSKVISTAANAKDTLTCVIDGTVLLCSLQKEFV